MFFVFYYYSNYSCFSTFSNILELAQGEPGILLKKNGGLQKFKKFYIYVYCFACYFFKLAEYSGTGQGKPCAFLGLYKFKNKWQTNMFFGKNKNKLYTILKSGNWPGRTLEFKYCFCTKNGGLQKWKNIKINKFRLFDMFKPFFKYPGTGPGRTLDSLLVFGGLQKKKKKHRMELAQGEP